MFISRENKLGERRNFACRGDCDRDSLAGSHLVSLNTVLPKPPFPSTLKLIIPHCHFATNISLSTAPCQILVAYSLVQCCGGCLLSQGYFLHVDLLHALSPKKYRCFVFTDRLYSSFDAQYTALYPLFKLYKTTRKASAHSARKCVFSKLPHLGIRGFAVIELLPSPWYTVWGISFASRVIGQTFSAKELHSKKHLGAIN